MDLKRKSDALQAVEPNTKRRFESTGSSKNHLAMDVALKQSPVIQTLFSFMSIQEVNLLKQVCRTWYEEAIELFQLGPVIDNCSLIKMNIEPVLESLSNEEKSEVLKKLTAVYQKYCLKALQDSGSESKVEGSKTNSSSYPSITEPHLVWHFLWRGNKVHPLSKPNFSAILGDYLQSGMKCIPSFSFLNLDHEVDWNHDSIDPKYPTILLKQSTSFITNRSERKIYETLNCLLESALPSSCLPDEMYGYNFFEAFHINRYASEHKIILTDWSNRGKNEPNFEDPQFPVKLLIYFVNERGQERVIEKYMKYVQFDVSGGFLNQSLEPPTLLYHDPKFEGFRSTNAISFAVAGENIKSATWEVMYKEDSTPSLKDARLQAFKFLEDCRLQALKFKASLDFPIDDNRTFGFVFYKNCSYRKRRGGYRHFFDTVSKVFPDLKLFKLRLFGGERGQTILRVHLIRI